MSATAMAYDKNNLTLGQYLEQKDIGFYEYQENTVPDFVIKKHRGKCVLLYRKALSRDIYHEAQASIVEYRRYNNVFEMASQIINVCFLDKRAIKALFAGLPGTARYVCVRVSFSRHWIIAAVGLMWRLKSKQFRMQGVQNFSSHGITGRWVVLYRPKLAIPSGERLAISLSMGVQGFLDYLQKEKINYVVLRFFEKLPAIGRVGGDLDILVTNEDESKVRDFFQKYPNTGDFHEVKVDIWPVANPNFNSASYYPSSLARQIIENAIDGPAGSRIPAPKESFLSFAYHAVYHKGCESGIPTSYDNLTIRSQPDNDYAADLARLAKDLGITVGVTLECLDDYLYEHGWRPGLDTLAKIASENEWVKMRFFSVLNHHDTGVQVIVIKKRAIQLSLEERIVNLIGASGEFEILRKKYIEPKHTRHVAERLRGGVWASKDSRYREEDYFPSVVIIVVDKYVAHRSNVKIDSRNVSLIRIRNLKKLLRDSFDSEHTSIVHATDTTGEAWEYISVCFPGEIEEIKKEVASYTVSVRLSWILRIRLQFSLLPSYKVLYKEKLKEWFIKSIVE